MQLAISTFGTSLRKRNDLFQILVPEHENEGGEKVPKQTVEISAKKIQSILIATGAHFSSDAVQLAVENNIDVIFLDKFGNPYGRVWHSKLGSTTLIRRRQLELAESLDGLKLAVEWVAVKFDNQAGHLKDLARTRQEKMEKLNEYAERIVRAKNNVTALEGTIGERRGTIMGIEGSAGRTYFEALSFIMPERFKFEGRSRNPAKDEFNCLLNYGYGVLYSIVERGCILAGLDPYVGFVHADNYNKKSMVFDIIEMFRIHPERVVVKLFSGRKIKESFFDKVRGGLTLNSDGKKILIQSLNEHFDTSVRYRNRNIKIRDTVQFECHRIAKKLLEGLPEAEGFAEPGGEVKEL